MPETMFEIAFFSHRVYLCADEKAVSVLVEQVRMPGLSFRAIFPNHFPCLKP
jgi:hypothetical protein